MAIRSTLHCVLLFLALTAGAGVGCVTPPSVEPAARQQLYRVKGLTFVLWLLVLAAGGSQRKILVEAASLHHVEQLHAAADPQDGQPAGQGLAQEGSLEGRPWAT